MNGPLSAKEIIDIVAGGLGGVVRWASLKLMWPDGVVSLLVGCVIAHYFSSLGDVLIDAILSPITAPGTKPSEIGAGGFIVGVSGMNVATFLIQFVKLKLENTKGNKE